MDNRRRFSCSPAWSPLRSIGLLSPRPRPRPKPPAPAHRRAPNDRHDHLAIVRRYAWPLHRPARRCSFEHESSLFLFSVLFLMLSTDFVLGTPTPPDGRVLSSGVATHLPAPTAGASPRRSPGNLLAPPRPFRRAGRRRDAGSCQRPRRVQTLALGTARGGKKKRCDSLCARTTRDRESRARHQKSLSYG